MNILEGLPPYTLYIITGLFFLVNLLLGLYKGRGVKTFRNYAIADKSMGTGTLAITIIATIISSRYATSLIVSPQNKTVGIIGATLLAFILPFFVLFLAYFVLPKLLIYEKCYTLGDIIGKVYGKEAQVLTGLISIGSSIFLIAAQLLAVGHVAIKLGLNFHVVIFGLGVTIILYTWIGGIRSVAFTDILQFVCLAVGFLFLSYRVLQLTDKEGIVIGSVQRLFFLVKAEPSADYFRIFSHNRFYNIAAGCSMLTLAFFSPPIINRILVAKNTLQMQRALYGFSFFYPILMVLTIVIGFGLLITHGSEPIRSNVGFAKIAECFFAGNPWAMVMLFVMLLAVVMSTADSFLNSSVIVVIRDLIVPLRGEKKRVKPMQLIPYIAFMIGSMAIALAFFLPKARINTLVVASERVLAIFVVPILLLALRLKADKKVFWSSVVSFSLILGILLFLGKKNYITLGDPTIWKSLFLRRKSASLIIIALLPTFVLSLVAHYIVYGKFVFESKSIVQGSEKGAISAFWQALKHPVEWASDKLFFEASAPVMIGMFLSFSWMLPELTAPQPHSSNLKVLFWVRIIGLFLCTGLLLHNRWKDPFKRYYPLFYYFTLGYGLPFSYTLSLLYNPNNKLNTILAVVALVVLMVLVNQRLFLFLTTVGGLSAIALARISPVQETFTYEAAWLSSIAVGYTLLVSFLFIRFKELAIKQWKENFKVWTLGYNHDMAPAHSALINFPRFIDNFLKKKRKEVTEKGKTYYHIVLEKEEYQKEIQLFLDHLKSGGEMADTLPKAFDQLIKDEGISKAQLKEASLLRSMKKGFIFVPESYKSQIDIQIDDSQDFKAEIHDVFFANMISNLVKNAVHHGKATKIAMGCNPKTHEVFIKDNGKGIPSHVEPYIFNLYFSTGSTGVGLPFIRQIIEAMGGKIRFETSPLGTTFFIFFPEIDPSKQAQQKALPLRKRKNKRLP